MSKELKQNLAEQGYFNFKEIEGRGLCGLMKFVFTTGLVYGMDEFSYKGRYCFENTADAKEALYNWDGIGDPSGDWIKHKGSTEYSNPKSKQL
jgi:hypothetical protein